MLNFELPAFYAGNAQTYFSSVPEFAPLIAGFVNDSGYLNAIDTGIYPEGINSESVPTNMMEDGVSYRFAGVPYFINIPTYDSDWIQNHYHTVYDSSETYSEEVMDINIKMFGALAINIDQSPALLLDFQATCRLLSDTLDQEMAEEAGADTAAYKDALAGMTRSAEDLTEEIISVNAQYEAAYAEGDEDTMSRLRAKGRELNHKSLAAFKYVQDHLIGLFDTSRIIMRHEAPMENIEMIQSVLTALEKGELSNDEETGIAALFDEDISLALEIYTQALEFEQNLLKEHVTNETEAMAALAEMLEK